MSKGYPSKLRAAKAYWRGVEAATRGLPNPYKNLKLMDLWARGLHAAKANPSLVVPPEFRPRPAAPPKPSRPASRRPDRGGFRNDRSGPGPNDRRPGGNRGPGFGGGGGGGFGGGGSGWGRR